MTAAGQTHRPVKVRAALVPALVFLGLFVAILSSLGEAVLERTSPQRVLQLACAPMVVALLLFVYARSGLPMLIGYATGSALSAVVLQAATPTRSTLPIDRGYTTAALLGAALWILCAALAAILPGRSSSTPAPGPG